MSRVIAEVATRFFGFRCVCHHHCNKLMRFFMYRFLCKCSLTVYDLHNIQADGHLQAIVFALIDCTELFMFVSLCVIEKRSVSLETRC